MEKKTFEQFLKKYSLEGSVEGVKLVAKDKTLRTAAVTSDKTLLISVQLDNFIEFDNAEVGVYDTSKLKKMVSSFISDNISVSPNVVDGKIVSLKLSDEKQEYSYTAADPSVIQNNSPGLKTEPEYNCEIILDNDFMSRFIKAKAVLQDIDLMTLMMDDDKLKLVIGYDVKLNSNRAIFNVSTTEGKSVVSKPITFSAKYFKEVLNANSDCSNAVFKVSDQGLATILFEKDNFKSQYWFVAIESND